MNDTERLQAIRAKCAQLLEIASKRTPGEWEAEGTTVWWHDPERESSSICDTVSRADFSDAAFIAACAGPAEAGWRATIAAIDFAESMPGHIWRESLEALILAAWKDINLEGGAK